MNNIDRARLLIRLATGTADEADRRAALAWADDLLAGNQTVILKPQPHGINFPVPIFRRYKMKKYDGFLLQGWKVQLNGRVYESVSGAAYAVSGHNENGWRIWRYQDEETQRERPIDALRK